MQRPSGRGKLRVILVQIGLVGTALAAFRLLSSPSTLTFFVFESALAATVGMSIAVRLAPRGDTTSSRESEPGRDEDDETLSQLDRLTYLANRIDLPSGGGIQDLRQRINMKLSEIRAKPPQRDGATAVDLLIERIAPKAYPGRLSERASSPRDKIGALAEEGNSLITLTRDLGLPLASHGKRLRKATDATGSGRVATAARILETSIDRLRSQLKSQIAEDLGLHHLKAWRISLALSSIFVVSCAAGLWSLSEGLYVAPLPFHALVAVAAGTLVLNAHVSGNWRPGRILSQVMALALLLKLHFFYLNAYLYTSDSVFHFAGVLGIASTRYVPGEQVLGHYSFFPGYHVFGFAGATVTNLPLTWFGLFAFAAQLAAIPVTYLIAREIAGPRTGLFASILALFSIFFFLQVIPLPSLFGFVFLFTALYSVVKMRGPPSRVWLVVFWISSLGAFFSHPVTALVLLLALVLRFIHIRVLDRKTTEAGAFVTPVLSYGVVYAGYLAFIALVSFELFVRSIFAPTSEAPLSTAPAQELQATGEYILQAALAPAGLAILFLFSAYGIFAPAGISRFERRFLVLLAVAFILVPALEVVAESFRTQSARFLGYITIPLVLLGGHGIASVNRLLRRSRRVGGVMIPILVLLAFASSSTYLTNNDNRSLYSTIPVIPTHITESALASREFLAQTGGQSTVYMDFGSWHYFGSNAARSRDALMMDTHTLDELQEPVSGAYVVLNDELLGYGSVDVGGFYDVVRVEAMLAQAEAALIYDSGTVRVFVIP